MWTNEELEEHQPVQANVRSTQETGGGEDGDPLLAFGKMVKVAGKSIWKKVSNKDLSKQKEKRTNEKSSASPVTITENGEPEPEQATPVITEQHHALATITTNIKDVPGSNEDDADQFLSVGQTETIVEGHTKYSWVNGKTEENAVPPLILPKGGASPTRPFEASPPSVCVI